MLSPSQGSTNISVSSITNTSASLNWANGNGNNRIVVLKPESPIDSFPVDGANYISNTSFGLGTTLGNSNYVVFNGSSNTVNISGLSPNVTYHVRIFEYNQNSSTGNLPLYQLCNCGILSFTTTCSPPSAAILGPSSGCGNIILTASSGSSYNWSGGQTPTTALNTFTSSGTYTVTVTDALGCSGTSHSTITVISNPVASITTPSGSVISCNNPKCPHVDACT